MEKQLPDVAVGDIAHRLICGALNQDLNISEVTEDRIICGPWTFDRRTGKEIDDDLSSSPSRLTGITRVTVTETNE